MLPLLLAAGMAATASSTGLQPHAPILVDGDSDWCNSDDDGVVNCATADGSAQRPYRISGWHFVSSPNDNGIKVSYTTKHFVIEGNRFHAEPGHHRQSWCDKTGIQMWPADNGWIRDNDFEGLDCAVEILWSSEQNRITRNTFTNNVKGVAQSWWSDSVHMRNNDFHDNDVAILAEGEAASAEANRFTGAGIGVQVGTYAESVRFWDNDFRTPIGVSSTAAQRIDATCNYWNHPSGPDAGAEAHGNIETSPHRGEAAPHAGRDGQRPFLPPSQDWIETATENCRYFLTEGPI